MKLKLTKTLLSGRPTERSILIALTGLFVMGFLFSLGDRSLEANGRLVFQDGQYWRAFTTSLLHGDFSHIANNSFFFTGLAILLNTYFGFWVFPVLSFIVGGLINLVTLHFYPPEVYLVGISGVIYFMAAFWLVLYIGIERKISLIRRLINALALSLIFLFPDAIKPQVSYLAHFTGFVFGLVLGLGYYFIFKNKFKQEEVWEVVKPDPIENIIYLDEGEYLVIDDQNSAPLSYSSPEEKREPY